VAGPADSAAAFQSTFKMCRKQVNVGPLRAASCGSIGWGHTSVIEYIELLATTELFTDYCQEQGSLWQWAMLSTTKISLQRENSHLRHASLLAQKCAHGGKHSIEMYYITLGQDQVTR
jgi:hypothetical protein